MNKKMLVVYLLMLLIPINRVYADGISISCPNEVEKNSEFSCQLMGNSSTAITSFEASLTLEGEIKLISFRADIEVWAGGKENDELDKISAYGGNNTQGNFNIGTLKFKNNGSSNIITIDNIIFYDTNYKPIVINTISSKVNVKEENTSTGNTTNNNSSNGNGGSNTSDNKNNDDIDNSDNTSNNDTDTDKGYYLSNIEIKGYEIDFSRDIYEYTLKIGNEDVLDITPVLEDNNSSYIITGNDKLVNGSVIKIKVITDENNEKVYTINILKDKEIEVVKNNNYKYIFIVIIGVLLIINIVRLLRRRKKNEE